MTGPPTHPAHPTEEAIMPLPGQMEFPFMAPDHGKRSASSRTARLATPRDASGGKSSETTSSPETQPARSMSKNRRRGQNQAEEAA